MSWFWYLFLVVVVGVIAAVMFRGSGLLQRQRSSQDFVGIEGVDRGVLLLPGGRSRLVVEVAGAVNFGLLSPEEQDRVEASFRRLLASLNFPVQFHCQTRLLDVSREIEAVRGAVVPESMREYAADYARSLESLMGQQILVRRNFLVISCDDGSDAAEAAAELGRRGSVIAAELGNWLGCRVLSSDEVIALFYTAYNKDRALETRAGGVDWQNYRSLVVGGRNLADVRNLAREYASRFLAGRR